MRRVGNAHLGFQPAGWPALINPRIPWTRPRSKKDPIWITGTDAGRRLSHPYLPDIIYPSFPDRTIGFDWDVIRKTRASIVRTEGGSAAAHYSEFSDDILIREVWNSQISVPVGFWRLLREYRETALETGAFIGWHPRDLSPYNYFVELLDVKVGEEDIDEVSELGDHEPYMLPKPLSLVFKLVREARSPAGQLVMLGF